MMNKATAILLQHANDIFTELNNDQTLKTYKTELLIVGEKFATLNKRLNRIYKQRYSDKINSICDLTSQQIKEIQIISQQYLSSRIKYNYLNQAAKAIQLGTLLNYANYLYLKTTKEVNFTSDLTDLIAAYQQFILKFDCQLNPDEDIKEIESVTPFIKKCVILLRKIFNT